MSKPLGGRGKKSSYVSTHVRIPDDIKDDVEFLKQMYFDGELDQWKESVKEDAKLAEEYRRILASEKTSDLQPYNLLTSFSATVSLAKTLLKQKKNARETVAKLLSAISGKQITIEDLKD